MEPEESKCLSSQLFGLLDGLVSHNPQIILSFTNGNRSALLGEFSVLSAPGSVSMSPVLPLATQAFVQSEASLTGSPTPVASLAFTSSEIFPAVLTVPLASGSSVISEILHLPGFTRGRTGASAFNFLGIGHCLTSSDLPAGIKCRANGDVT